MLFHFYYNYLFLVSGEEARERKKSRAGSKPFGDEARLLKQLMKGYEKAVRPVANASHIITVKINFGLTQILDMVSYVFVLFVGLILIAWTAVFVYRTYTDGLDSCICL